MLTRIETRKTANRPDAERRRGLILQTMPGSRKRSLEEIQQPSGDLLLRAVWDHEATT
jgi:hypothetical protein